MESTLHLHPASSLRIRHLWTLIHQFAATVPELSQFYLNSLVKIAEEEGIEFDATTKERFCSHCTTFRIPSINCKVRISLPKRKSTPRTKVTADSSNKVELKSQNELPTTSTVNTKSTPSRKKRKLHHPNQSQQISSTPPVQIQHFNQVHYHCLVCGHIDRIPGTTNKQRVHLKRARTQMNAPVTQTNVGKAGSAPMSRELELKSKKERLLEMARTSKVNPLALRPALPGLGQGLANSTLFFQFQCDDQNDRKKQEIPAALAPANSPFLAISARATPVSSAKKPKFNRLEQTVNAKLQSSPDGTPQNVRSSLYALLQSFQQ